MSTQERAICRRLLLLLIWMLAGCGLRPYLPAGPSLSDAARQEWLAQERDPVDYTGLPRVAFPIVPFQVFALHYEEDIVVETTHPVWGLHEYARVLIGKHTLWIAKDADRHGVQTVSASAPEILTWFPEVPVPRRIVPFTVDDSSSATMLQVNLSYQSPLEEQITVSFRSPRPPQPVRRRNGSTFNHSAHLAAAVLDIPARQHQGIRAQLTYNGQPATIRRLLGLFPVQALLTQTQGGFVATSMRMTAGEEATVHIERPIPGHSWPTRARETWAFTADRLRYRSHTSDWEYHVRDGGLERVTVSQVGQPQPLLQMVLSAPLPDFSRPFRGQVIRHFVLLINGQAHGHGRLQAVSGTKEASLEIRPVAPAWLASRPLRTQVVFRDDRSVDVRSTRIE